MQIDVAQNGYLDVVELHARMHDTGHTDEEIERLFLSLDRNHDQIISQQEFKDGYELFLRAGGR